MRKGHRNKVVDRSVPLSLRWAEQDVNRLIGMCQRRGKSISELIREYLGNGLTKDESAYFNRTQPGQ